MERIDWKDFHAKLSDEKCCIFSKQNALNAKFQKKDKNPERSDKIRNIYILLVMITFLFCVG